MSKKKRTSSAKAPATPDGDVRADDVTAAAIDREVALAITGSALERREDELTMGDGASSAPETPKAHPSRPDADDRRRTAERRRRLARAGCHADDCALLGVELDVGPRAQPHRAPVRREDVWVSTLGAAILDAGVDASTLEHAAAVLRDRDRGQG